MKKKIYLLFLVVISSFFFTACIRDTDFNQTDNIVVSPVFELDFLFFTVSSDNFFDNGINNFIVTDTTDFDFLNDEFVVDNLEKAEFFFKNTNSFPVEFNTQFQFLDENNELHYEISIPINSGDVNNPVITEYTELIVEEDLINLTMANKVVINIIASSSVENLEGTLKLQSKTTYYLKIVQ